MGERIGMDIVNMIWDRCAAAIENNAEGEEVKEGRPKGSGTAEQPDRRCDRYFSAGAQKSSGTAWTKANHGSICASERIAMVEAVSSFFT